MRAFGYYVAVLLLGISCEAQTSVVITPTPSDGESSVAVTFPALSGDQPGLLYSHAGDKDGDVCSADSSDLLALKAGVPNTAAKGSKALVLIADKPLQAGTPVCAKIGSDTSTVVVVKSAAAPPGFDWGHVRAYFTAGSLISQASGQFSHQDLFLSFRLDKAYWTTNNSFLFKHNQTMDDGTYRPGLHTYFETRMTALPVAVQSCAPSTSAETTTSTAGATCSASSNSSSTGSSATADTTETFLNSQKSARLEFGAFYPIYFPHWAVTSKSGGTASVTHYALFIAPLIETGFDTSLNGLNQTQQQASTSSQVQPIGTSSQFYKFYDYGFRLGHDRLTTDSSSAPEELSYLNVGWGRFSNLASLLCPAAQYTGNNSCSAPSGTLPWQRDLRLRVEGLLQIPATTGLSIGFSSNVGLHRKSQADVVHIQPADDLRFMFGYKFDISKLAAKIKGF